MKINVENGLYIQRKDLELIFESSKNKQIPNSILKKYQDSVETKDLGFILFDNGEDVEFLNGFWFVVNYNDIIDFDDIEILDYYFKDLQNLRKQRVDYDKNKFLPEEKIYDNYFEALLDELRYYNYIPNKKESKNFPLEFQLLYNKVTDIHEINSFKRGISNLELPEEVFKPVRYGKKKLQQIYYEVLSEDLTFEELKPYEKQLYSIFSRINYSPEILNIIRKVMIINRHNTVDFIDEDLMDLILRIEGKDTKFEESTWGLIDYIYAIGYNQFENFDSKITLEKDMKIIKKVINNISWANLGDEDIKKLSNYNYVLGEIANQLKECNFSSNRSQFVREVVLNMSTYVFFNPNAINNDFSSISYICDYITNNTSEVVNIMGGDLAKVDRRNENFVENFNRANSLLLYLYDKKYQKDMDNQFPKLNEQSMQTNLE